MAPRAPPDWPELRQLRAYPGVLGRLAWPITVPITPPAAAPMTALFTLRPVAAPRIAPAAAPRIVPCTPLAARRCEPDAVDGCSAGGAGRGAGATSPSAVVVPAATTSGWVDAGATGGGDSFAALVVAAVGAVARVGALAGVDRRLGALATTAAADDCRARATFCVGVTGARSGIGAFVPVPTFVCDLERSVRRWRASSDSALVGASAR